MHLFGKIPSETCKSEPEKSEVWSFDIFGTLLTRLQPQPKDRFHSAYKKIISSDKDPQRLATLRIRAEAQAALRLGADLYSLDDIYGEMAALDENFSALKERAREAELQMEREQCFGITQGTVLWGAAKKGSRIIYASDMYLPPEFLQELLERNGVWVPGARLFISHAEGCAKHSGLFAKICREMRIEPGQLTHVGDHRRSDMQVPRQAGIHTIFIQPGENTRYEKKIREAGLDKLADAIRAARLQFPASLGSTEKILWETACSVAAPLFIAYTVWLCQRARAMGLETLFFISRDGLIFKKIYDQLPLGGANRPTGHYLYGSREAWICARLARLSPENVSFLVLPNPTLSFFQLAGRCNLEPKELEPPPWDRHSQMGEKALDRGQMEWISKQLKSGPWRETIQNRARQRLAEVREYFRQEGVGARPYALVDLGWFGNLQEYVEWILPEAPPQHGFYLDLRKWPRIQREKRASSFIADLKVKGLDGSSSITLLEILAAAPHGTCRGYRLRDGVWGPNLETEPGFFAGPGMIDRQHEAILAVLSGLVCLEPDLTNLPLEVWREVAQKNFISLLQSPSPHEAEVLGSAIFVSRQEGGAGVEFGPACNLVQAWNIFRQGFRTREAAWPQAMIRRSCGVSRFLLAMRYFISQARARVECIVWH